MKRLSIFLIVSILLFSVNSYATVAESTSRIKQSCNGSLTAFPFTFNAGSLTEFTVILTDSAGTETTLTDTTHYSVSCTNDDCSGGGTVTTVATYASGYSITILRNVPLTQESDFYEGQRTLYESFENELDKGIRIDQQQNEGLARSIQIAESSDYAGSEYIFPDPSANELIGWNAAGDELRNWTRTQASTGGHASNHTDGTDDISGLDISDQTNLAVTAPIVLTDDTLSITVAKDIVTSSPLSGGENNVLPGADADLTLSIADADDAGTKGAATFDATDFDDDGSGGITIVDDGHLHTGISVSGVGGMFLNPQYPDKESNDQGALDGSYYTVFDIIAAFPSEIATIVFQHDGVSTNTDYAWTTSDVIPANLAILIEPGARLTIATGITVTIEGDFQAVPSLRCIVGTGSGNVLFDIATDEPAGDVTANAPRMVYLEWWGADGDPTTDDHVAMEQATVALGNATYGGGGIIQLLRGRLYLFNDDVVNQKWQTLRGNTNPSHLGGWNKANDTSIQKGGIYIDTGATIDARGTIEKLNLYREGLTGKEATTGSFAGTAITITANNSDVTIENVWIVGFAQAIISTDAGRGYFHRVYGDTIDGIDVSGSADVTRIIDCHFYPFLTSHLGLGNANLQRAGTAYYLHAQADWAIIQNSFSFGYETGVELQDVHGVTVSNHGADQDATQRPANKAAYWIHGTTDSGDLSKGNTIISSRAAGHDFGIWVSQTGDAQPHTFVGNTIWTSGTYGILLQGDVNASITGNNLWQASTGGTGIYVNDAQINATITGNVFENWTTDIIDASSADVTISQNMAEDGPVWADRFGGWAVEYNSTDSNSGTVWNNGGAALSTDTMVTAYIIWDSGDPESNAISIQSPIGTTLAIDGFHYTAASANALASVTAPIKKGSTVAVVFTSTAGGGTAIVVWSIPIY